MHGLGETIPQPALAESLQALSRTGVAAFYGGTLGQALARDVQAAGGLLSTEDLAAHQTLFQEPLRVMFRDHELLTAPPNTQGIALSLLLGFAEQSGAKPPSPPWLDAFMAWKEAAFAVRDRELGDPALASGLQPLLDPEALLAALPSAHRCDGKRPEGPAGPARGDTSTLVVIDEAGNAVSWVQSIFKDFGSGVVSENTGILVQNRLHLASLEPGGANSLAPGRRPFHTLCPALLMQDGQCRLAIATPGDHGQPQSLAQVIVNLLARGMDVQEAIEAPRIRHDLGKEVLYEDRLERGEVEAISAAGYTPRSVGPWSRLMGGVNAIYCPDGDVRMGGADPRRASYAVSY